MFPYSRAVTPWVKGPKRPQIVLVSFTSFPLSPFFFFPTENFLAIFFFSLILLLRWNFFLLYSDHPIRSLLSPEFPFSLFSDRKCLADLGKGCEQGAPSTAGHSLGLIFFFFFPSAHLLLCFLLKSHQQFCKPRLWLRNQLVCGEKSDISRGTRGRCWVWPFSCRFV